MDPTSRGSFMTPPCTIMRKCRAGRLTGDHRGQARPPFNKNGFVVGCPDTREGVIIDPGDEVDELLEVVRQHELTVKYILLTHAHLDHITGVDRAKAAFDVPVVLHRGDEFLYKAVVQQGIAFGFRRAAAARRLLLDGRRPWRSATTAPGSATRRDIHPAASAWRSAANGETDRR